jgi:RHS repeat-associated protein
VSDQIIIHNERNSSFGAGWTIAGLQRAYENSNGRVMLTEGTASSLIFDPLDPAVDPNGFVSPPGDFSALTRLGDGTLERRMKGGTRFSFDSAGLLVQALDRNGNLTTYVYDTAQRLTGIVDPVGKSYTLSYAAGRLSTISDPLNRTTNFEHDSEGNLIAIVEPNGDRRKFEYSPGNNRMIAQTDQRENRTQYFYDFAGRISETLLPDGSNPKFSPGQVKGVANPAPVGQEGDGSRGLPTPAPLLLEDLNNTYTDHNGNESSEVTDLRHKPIRINDALDRSYEYERDEDSNRTKRVRPNGSVVDNTFDDRGNQLTRTEQFNSAFYQYSYDTFSQITSYTNPNRHTTTFNRDPANGNLLSLVNHLGHTTTYEYDSRGLLERLVTPNQLEVTFTYSPQGLVQTMTETPPAGSSGNPRLTQYSYDPAGQLTQAITPDGITVDIEYDDKGRRTRVSDNLDQATEYIYDAHDNLAKTDTRNGDGSLALTVENVFDTRNRYFKSRAPHVGAELSETMLGLDNNSNVIDLSDPNENAASNEYDEEDRLRKNTHRLDGITLYEYDSNDRVTQVTAPNGVVTSYTYDVLGRKLTETSADRGQLLYSYDPNNNLASVTDGRGIETILNYDDLERVDIKTFPNTVPGKIEDVDYIYDDCPFGVGRLCERHDESGTWRYEYDAFGNVVKETRVELGVTYTTEYVYDDGDNITRISYPTGRMVNIARDGLRRIEAIDSDINGVNTDIVSNIQYRADNRMTQCTFGNGLVDSRSYDLQSRLLNQSLSSIDNRNYTYDKNSNMLSRSTTPQSSVYGYDALDRLTSDRIDTDDPFIYQYDLNHNRQTKTQAAALGENYDYESSSNRLVRHNQFSETTLPASVNDRQYVYSDSKRIFQVFDDGLLNAEYIYNDNGQRTRKVIYDNSVSPATSSTTLYHYGLAGYLIAETDASSVSSKEYIWTEGLTPIAQIDVNSGVDTLHYLHTDHLMTPRFATTSSQQVSWRWEGEAFGNTDDQDVRVDVNLRFPGQYFDLETGLHYNLSRYYDASVGRYHTSDSIGLAGGSNTFGYANGSPLTHFDSAGTNALIAFGGLLQESYNFVNGQGFNGCNVYGALKDGYNGEGDGFGWALIEDVLSFGTGALGALSKLALVTKGISNPIPSTLARVVPGGVNPKNLGATADVFVTDAKALQGLNARQIANKLTIPQNPSGFKVIEFPTPNSGIASPVLRGNPGFIGGGRTAGGASEFVIPNGPVPAGAITRIVQ